MKKLMILTAMVITGTLLMTGCSTCCKKDGSCTKPAASLSCTNHVNLAACPGDGCTNKFSLQLAECTKGGCTNKLALNDCTNKFNLLLTDCSKGCTNKFVFNSCTNHFNLQLTDCTKGCTNKLTLDLAECTKGGCTNKLSRING